MRSFADIEAALTAPLPSAAGAWTTAQHVDHCAASIAASVDGFPALKPAIIRGTIGKLVKRRFLGAGAMRHDTHAPLPGGAPPPPRELADARASLTAAIARFRSHRGAYALHPVYGRCTADEYERLHAIHVADHLRTVRGER